MVIDETTIDVVVKREFDPTIELADNVMLKHRPDLFDEWDFEKNDELGIDIYNIPLKASKKAHWMCSKCGSKWEAITRRRAIEGNNCPYCSGKKVNHTNSLENRYPELASEWHPTKNGELTPSQITFKFSTKTWWLCPKCDSDYDLPPRRRVNGSNCPYCGWRKVNHTNSLEATNPEVLISWDYRKNVKITPQTVKAGSDIVVNWVCNTCSSEYKRSVYQEIKASKCPYCAGHKVNHTNSLTILNPALASQWHPFKNGKLTPEKITCNSGKRFWWLGTCGHEWKTDVSSRNSGTGCPVCINQKVLIGFNDMWTTNPELASQLADPEDGYKYTEGSNIRTNWKCIKCKLLIKNRVISSIKSIGLSCPSCSDGIKFPEKFFYNALRQAGIDFEFQKGFDWSDNKRYDFYLTEIDCIVETHGMQHYVNSPFNKNNKKSGLETVRRNDAEKYSLAKNRVDKYVIIDARFSNQEFIASKILESPISILFKDVDFDLVYKNTLNSLVYEVCDMWNRGVRPITKICEELKIGQNTIRKYLSMGEKIGIVNYKEEARLEKNARIGTANSRKIVKLTINGDYIEEFESMTLAGKSVGYKSHVSILRCCKGRTKSAGGFRWMYAEEYYKEVDIKND